MPILPFKIKILLIIAKNCWKTEIKTFLYSSFHMKTRICLTYFVYGCRYWSFFMDLTLFKHCFAYKSLLEQQRWKPLKKAVLINGVLIIKTVLFIPQNLFQSTHTSSSVAKNLIKTVNILNLHVFYKNVTVLIKAQRFTWLS